MANLDQPLFFVRKKNPSFIPGKDERFSRYIYASPSGTYATPKLYHIGSAKSVANSRNKRSYEATWEVVPVEFTVGDPIDLKVKK